MTRGRAEAVRDRALDLDRGRYIVDPAIEYGSARGRGRPASPYFTALEAPAAFRATPYPHELHHQRKQAGPADPGFLHAQRRRRDLVQHRRQLLSRKQAQRDQVVAQSPPLRAAAGRAPPRALHRSPTCEPAGCRPIEAVCGSSSAGTPQESRPVGRRRQRRRTPAPAITDPKLFRSSPRSRPPSAAPLEQSVSAPPIEPADERTSPYLVSVSSHVPDATATKTNTRASKALPCARRGGAIQGSACPIWPSQTIREDGGPTPARCPARRPARATSDRTGSVRSD